MYQSFTGSSRRPRQVNLSGRNTNPFAAVSVAPQGPQQAIQSAHQDRQQRQQQRLELNAAKNLQRTWRGYSSRKKARDAWRAQWDAAETSSTASAAYPSPDESLGRLRSLLLFFTPNQPADIKRLLRYGTRQRETAWTQATVSDPLWPVAYLRLEKACLSAVPSTHPEQTHDLLQLLSFLATQIPAETSGIALDYYRTLSRMSHATTSDVYFDVAAQPLSSGLLPAYEGFVAAFLVAPHEPTLLARIASRINLSTFVEAASMVTTKMSLGHRGRLWLLSQYIHLVHEHQRSVKADSQDAGSLNHIPTIARLLASLTEDISPEAPALDMDNMTYDRTVLKAKNTKVQLNTFIKDQLARLVDQKAIRSLLARPVRSPAGLPHSSDSGDAQLLAGYALTLLRMFPFRADDIRMWLYLGLPNQTSSGDAVPAIAYFWRGARATRIFEAIYHDPRAATDLLKASKPQLSSWQPPASTLQQSEINASEWRIIFVFLELYTFVLKIMDDEEFLGSGSGTRTRMSNNALPVPEIRDLSVFLKNLGFSMYFNSNEISESFQQDLETLTPASLSRHFGGASHAPVPRPESHTQSASVAGIMGVSLDYLKGLITGLLRSIYERDSRRSFLPKDHWLMTSRFDMLNFIREVVQEEERRDQLQKQEDEEGDVDEEADIEPWTSSTPSRAQGRFRLTERDQRRASRKRYLEAVAPRLEILQNMPFLIPFETRVEIFREFVRLDQKYRRGGFVEPDMWRQSIMFRSGMDGGQAELLRHHAKIRRRHEFDDAFDQFYQIGADIKEPIQITFVDEFDIEEAGIDGGGVTKEFLTSVTSEALNPSRGLFEENGQHLLYPNPTSLEERKQSMQLSGFSESDPEYRSSLRELLRQYEFLGRVVGKCLYEGILIDVGFAGFFLSKWALFGGAGAGRKESGYRPTINDLRDLDEGLYKGLLDLKYYTGDVEDWATTFTIVDEIPIGEGKTKTIERDLIPNGSSTPVTNENRLLYISAVARYRLAGQSSPQTTAFLQGLASVVQPSWLSMFNQLELQTLIGGAASSIDVPDLRRNTHYGGVYVIGDDQQEHPSIALFWSVMETMPDEDRRKVLKFVTSTPRAPLLGFASLNPRFSIRDAGDDESRFPTTSTCVNLLKLPRYKSADVLREKLLYAVHSGAGFDLS
ncbi:hypothetical protein MBLNU459_g1007t1 [Dothideomycetes sp. NU459]